MMSLSNSTKIPSAITVVPGINCDTVEYIQRYTPNQILEISQLFLSCATIFLVILGGMIQRQAYFHPNVKVLLKIYNSSLLMYSFAMTSSQLYHILTAQLFENCELLISSRLCFPFRFIFTTTTIMFALLVSSIPIERTIATKNLTDASNGESGGYENRKSTIGTFLGTILTGFSLIFSFFYHISDFAKNRTSEHCIYDSEDIVPDGLMMLFCVMNTVSLICIIVLLCYNRYKLYRKTYSLSAEFQIVQNLRVLNLLLPISLLTCAVFAWDVVLNFYSEPKQNSEPEIRRFLAMLKNGFPIYTFFSSALWLFLMNLERKKRRIGHERMVASMKKDEKDVYFQTLQDQWSRHPTPKTSRIQLFNVFTVPRSSMTL